MKKDNKFIKILFTILLPILVCLLILSCNVISCINNNNSQTTEQIEKKEKNIIPKSSINTDNNTISFERRYFPYCIIEDNVDFYIISFAYDLSLKYEIIDDIPYIDSYSLRTFLYRSAYIELSDYHGISLDDDFSTPIWTFYDIPISSNGTIFPLDSFEYFLITPSVSTPYYLDYFTYRFSCEFCISYNNNMVFSSYDSEDLKSFNLSEFTLDLDNKELRKLYYDGDVYNVIDFNSFSYENSFKSGYNLGFYDGEQAQKEVYKESDTALSKIWVFLQNGVETALNVLNIEILPGIPLTIVVIVPLIFGIIFFIWKGGSQ